MLHGLIINSPKNIIIKTTVSTITNILVRHWNNTPLFHYNIVRRTTTARTFVTSQLCSSYNRYCRSTSSYSGSSRLPTLRKTNHHYYPIIVRTMVQGVDVEHGTTIINRNPATNEIISRVPCTTTDEIHVIMENAKTAFHTVWGNHIPIKDRITYLRNAMEELSKKENEIIPWMVKEMGKPIGEATAEFHAACNKKNDRYMNLLEQSLQPTQHGTNSVVIRQPLGVVVILSPWNFPVDEIILLTLPALGSGNTVIVKPSEVSPEVGAMVVNTLSSMLPTGVLQLAQGDGIVGAQLVSHPTTRMVAMTGSSATGKHIMKETANDLKRLVLELGGKDPMIVFDDTDIEKAAQDAVEYSVCNAGQVCCSIERVYVADSIYDSFCDKVKQVASTYKVGNGMDPSNKVGPLVSSLQMNKVKDHVDDAIQNGAKLLFQSEIPTTEEEKMGTFYPVTVLADVQDGMKMYREETFGPVVCISKFDNSESEAVRLANDTDYGLGSCVYTQDIEKATRIANQIEAGQVGINCYAIDNMDITCPWVGHKQSGYGYHSGSSFQFSFRNHTCKSVSKRLEYQQPSAYNSMATIERSTSHADAPSAPLIAVGGRALSVQAASATTTMTMTEVPTAQGNNNGEVLRLTLRARPTVRWDENVEDNEGMGRKSSKRCCIFHKQREFGESSTDSSADENENSDDNNSDDDDKKPRGTNHERRKIARPKKKNNDVPDYQRFHA